MNYLDELEEYIPPNSKLDISLGFPRIIQISDED
jgi:hypothetical protein